MDNFTENGGRSLASQEDEAREHVEEIRQDALYTDAQARAERYAHELLTARTAIGLIIEQETDPDVLWFLWTHVSEQAVKLLEQADTALKARRAVLDKETR